MAESPSPSAADFPWAANLRHRTDPNRVTDSMPVQVLDIAAHQREPTSMPAAPAAAARPGDAPRSPQAPQAKPSYYDISLLKAPLWKWEIASYFFLGGLSSGAYILARLAERGGGGRYRNVTRLGTYLALGAAMACPPLLIADLGDPKRFHHMLRVWKPTSPMNVGTWVLTSYSGVAATAAVREWMRGGHSPRQLREMQRAASMPGKVLLAVHDAAGVPLALLLAGYTGVLLSCTANPMWSRNPWIGPLFSVSAFNSGASAITLAMAATSSEPDEASHRALEKVKMAGHLAEVGALAGYLRHAGPKARALTHGSMKQHLRFSLGALVGAQLLSLIPFRGSAARAARIVSSLVSLASAFSLRWAFVYGGHEAARDPDTARMVSAGNGSAK